VTVHYLDLDDILAAAVAAVAPAELLVRDWGLLESALARPRASAFGVDAYPEVWEKAGALLESLARNHPLVDGNKPLAWVATRLFLGLSGHDVQVPDPQTGDRFVRAVAQGQLDAAQTSEQLRAWKR
jgi:death-on-curing protein